MFRRRQKYAEPAAAPRDTAGYDGPATGAAPAPPARGVGPYGLTRAAVTLIAAGAAGLLIWIATQISDSSNGGFWAVYGLIAAAGLVMALSQLLGGWTKWGVPRLSASVFLIAFVPVAIVSLWVILAGEPHHAWFHNHVMAWTRDIHVSGLVTDMLTYIPVLAFGAGLVFGFSFDTSGPLRRRGAVAGPVGATRPVDRRASDEPVTAERREQAAARPREPVATDGRPTGDRTTTTTRTTDGS